MREYTDAERPRLLDLLKTRGPLNVPALAKLLGVNLTAVRQQLAVLRREGLVAMAVEHRRVGRPTHVFRLTESAEALFPQAYGPMAVSLLRQLRALDGEGKVERLFARRTRELAARYRERLAGLPAEEKLRELARIRNEEGYMARAERGGLTEHHCPIAAIAREFPQACLYEKRLFEEVLGRPLERTDHIASGDRACVYARAPRNAR
jgi:predicted ArsR family transcriptional regulator